MIRGTGFYHNLLVDADKLNLRVFYINFNEEHYECFKARKMELSSKEEWNKTFENGSHGVYIEESTLREHMENILQNQQSFNLFFEYGLVEICS